MQWHLAAATTVTLAAALVVRAVPPELTTRWRAQRGPECELPPRSCPDLARNRADIGFCGDLVRMPREGVGFRMGPPNGPPPAASYLRRDLAMLVVYAAAKVACKADGWRGNGGPIEVSDMSEHDGATPGTQAGLPRHPANTHLYGRDVDIAYYQRGTEDNGVRAICSHEVAGVDQYHCVSAPRTLDAHRTALFLGALLEENRIRVIGIDGAAATPILTAFDRLCKAGWIQPDACRPERIVYEIADTGRGWYRFHHGHLHVSWRVL